MSFNLCTSEAIIRQAGVNANSTAVASGALLADYCDKAEGIVCMKCHKDWITTAPPTTIANAVADAVAIWAAMKVIAYDPTGYITEEASTILNVLKDQFDNNIKDLRTKELQEFG